MSREPAPTPIGCPSCQVGLELGHDWPSKGVWHGFYSDGRLRPAQESSCVVRCPACMAFFWRARPGAAPGEPGPRGWQRALDVSTVAGLRAALATLPATPPEELLVRKQLWWAHGDVLFGELCCGFGCALALGALGALPLVVPGIEAGLGFVGDWLPFVGLLACVLVVALIWQLVERANELRGRDRPDGPFATNLTALLALLDEADPEQRVLAAEANRQLGRPDAARRLLDEAELPGHLRGWAAEVARLAKAGDRRPRRISPYPPDA